jgi:hypothetical protein
MPGTSQAAPAQRICKYGARLLDARMSDPVNLLSHRKRGITAA